MGVRYALSVSVVMLHPTTGLPLMETGRERRLRFQSETVTEEADPREVFLALAHQGAENLWPDFKQLLDGKPIPPTPKPTPP